MDGNAFRGLEELAKFVWFGFLIAVPLAIWKLVDIVVWIVQHVRVVSV